MLAPNTDDYRKRCTSGFAEVKFVNQVLAMGNECNPEPTCLLIDLGNSADLKDKRDWDRLAKRTGTPRFIARSVSSGMLLNKDDYSNAGVELPSTDGPSAAYYQFMHAKYQHQVDSTPDSTTETEMKFAHQLFHDAESTFWVIAWTLAQSAGPDYHREKNPHPNFCKFFYTMYQHYPTQGDDTRFVLWQSSKDYWKFVLHPNLENLGGMLSKMFQYVRPEWAYSQDLNPEHVHEALMRLLLDEIIRIDKDGKDTPLVIGIRSKPPPPRGVSALPISSMNSFSFHTTSSYPPTSGAFEHQRNSLGEEQSNNGGSSKRPDNSHKAKPRTRQPSFKSQQPITEQDEAVRREQEELAHNQLRERAERLRWDREICQLEPPRIEPPQPPAPDSQTPDQNISGEHL